MWKSGGTIGEAPHRDPVDHPDKHQPREHQDRMQSKERQDAEGTRSSRSSPTESEERQRDGWQNQVSEERREADERLEKCESGSQETPSVKLRTEM